MILLNLTPDEFDNRVENILIQALTKYGESLLKKIEPPKNDLVKIDVLLSTFQVSKQTVFNWAKRGLIKPRKIGRRTLYELNEILAQMNSNPAKFKTMNKFQDIPKVSSRF
jgi:hypothetical protein